MSTRTQYRVGGVVVTESLGDAILMRQGRLVNAAIDQRTVTDWEEVVPEDPGSDVDYRAVIGQIRMLAQDFAAEADNDTKAAFAIVSEDIMAILDGRPEDVSWVGSPDDQ